MLVTGHSGFKGSWLSLWLSLLGSDVTGVSMPQKDPASSHWQLLKLGIREISGDVRDSTWLRQIVEREAPEIIFHMAAQALVRRSYVDPLETWSTNVMGTANLLDACRHCSATKAVVVVTTDKVYENHEWHWGYRENDRLGGHDAYSASKAACEQVVSSYRHAFCTNGDLLIASARAGNVIGGGDWSEDRLIPDLVRAIGAARPLLVRSPNSTRPWQHVLDCLSGYLLLGEHLLRGERYYADAWNFGPGSSGNQTVSYVLEGLKRTWSDCSWSTSNQPQPHEAKLLYLDTSKARAGLGWHPVWTLEEALAATADWYKAYLQSGTVLSTSQLEHYVRDSRAAGLSWSEV